MKNELVKTELPFSKSKPIDELSTIKAIELIIEEQISGIKLIREQSLNLKLIINNVYKHLYKHPKGRLIYCGAGTSGRIAVQDAIELFPTFGWPRKRIGFLIAGGKKSLINSLEGAEDDLESAQKQFEKLKVNNKDIVIALAASGNTPFTHEVLRLSSNKNALTISISNNPFGKIIRQSKFSIILDTGEEVVAGSTRMKAGTSQKVILNLISTMVMIQFGYVKKGLMSNMVALNQKLRHRKAFIDEFLNE